MDHELLELHNGSPIPLVVWVEPWGERLEISPGSIWKMIDLRNPPSKPSITITQDGVAIYVLPEAELSILEGNCKVWQS